MHPNERLLRDTYEAVGRGDGRFLARNLSPETQWVIPGAGSKELGTHTGPGEVSGFWKPTAENAGGGLGLNVCDVLANDERAAALIDVNGQRSCRELCEVVVFELSDGKLWPGDAPDRETANAGRWP